MTHDVCETQRPGRQAHDRLPRVCPSDGASRLASVQDVRSRMCVSVRALCMCRRPSSRPRSMRPPTAFRRSMWARSYRLLIEVGTPTAGYRAGAYAHPSCSCPTAHFPLSLLPPARPPARLPPPPSPPLSPFCTHLPTLSLRALPLSLPPTPSATRGHSRAGQAAARQSAQRVYSPVGLGRRRQ